ncbi:MAG: OsmC family protein [Deltaproteobacteria bacterium]|nr:OsmC family protein [Deltaproteobacteria bacterium]
MQTKIVWQDKMQFTGELGEHRVAIDAKKPIGGGEGFTPKELLAMGIASCSGMDAVAYLRKYKQALESFSVLTNVIPTEGVTPSVFKDVALVFQFVGDMDPDLVLESVELSQTKYCGVSAMIVKAVPISYKVFLNEKEIGSGEAKFT